MYAKVFASMWDGTLYGQWEAWSVFVFMLAHADCEGFVDMHPKAISARSGLPLEFVEKGIAVLESEDEHSRSPDLEGRRLERIDAHRPWGWRIVNYTKYRGLRDADTIRSQTRERVRRHRDKLRNADEIRSQTLQRVQRHREKTRNTKEANSLNESNACNADANAQKRHAEAEAEVEVSDSSLRSESSCPTVPLDENLSVEAWTLKVFWPRYPRREGKALALKAMQRAFKGVSGAREDELARDIVRGLGRHLVAWEDKDRRFIPLPATWINGRRWEDELEST